MKLGLSLQTALQQTLTPQQIQYLKLLQLPVLQLEQYVRTEMETNPMLEESIEGAPDAEEIEFTGTGTSEPDNEVDASQEHEQIPDSKDAFEFQKMLIGDDPTSQKQSDYRTEDEEDDSENVLYRDTPSLMDDLLEQVRFLPYSHEERLLAEYIIGNVDDDGYLRRPLDEIIDEVNGMIAEHNLAVQAPALLGAAFHGMDQARLDGIDVPLNALTMKQAEVVLRRVQSLDPPGIASRTIQECLVAQLRAVPKPNAAQKLALMVLTDTYEAFAMKHYAVIERNLEVSEEYLREALDVIRHLNPRPGVGTFGPELNTVIPDFIVERDADHPGEVLITVNESRLPTLRVSSAFERLRKEARYKQFNKETKEWLRRKQEDAKFLIQAVRQRRHTMLRIMTAIAGLQKEFFLRGPEALRPLIYRDVAEISGLDISTVCRIVNGKYVLTEYGTFELKYFFSESLTTDDGEEVSTRIIKQKIKDMVSAESKVKPLSDDKLAKDLKKMGYNVARRTVAKYREQLKIPVARLRREL